MRVHGRARDWSKVNITTNRSKKNSFRANIMKLYIWWEWIKVIHSERFSRNQIKTLLTSRVTRSIQTMDKREKLLKI